MVNRELATFFIFLPRPSGRKEDVQGRYCLQVPNGLEWRYLTGSPTLLRRAGIITKRAMRQTTSCRKHEPWRWHWLRLRAKTGSTLPHFRTNRARARSEERRVGKE